MKTDNRKGGEARDSGSGVNVERWPLSYFPCLAFAYATRARNSQPKHCESVFINTWGRRSKEGEELRVDEASKLR